MKGLKSNPILLILVGSGFLFASVISVFATLAGSVVASGPLGWLATLVGGTVTYLFLGDVGATVVSFAGYILQFASSIFEIVLFYTVVGFGQTLSEFGILDGVKVVWAAFRDISNIVIIGMFVFVAIATILGSVNYGVRRFLVKVITVAILINFSLLFTQLAIDASHIVANQFYKGIRVSAYSGQTSLQAQSSGLVASAGLTVDEIWRNNGGVSGAFQKKMGVSTFKDTSTLIDQFQKTSGTVPALLYIVVASVLLIVTSGIFLYGAYLLLARALIIIVLLSTAALAFASHLIPNFGDGRFGWSSWLEALVRSAVFAPLLMAFLWASLKVLEGTTPGSMAAFLADPSNTISAGKTIIVYLFTIGMLYLSMKISSDFSKKITGFDIATTAIGMGGRLVGGALGFAGVHTVGRISRRLDESGAGKALKNEGRIWSKTTTPSSIERALAKLGSQALEKGRGASFSTSRIPEALSDKYDKFVDDYGLNTGGKGGFDAYEARKEKREKTIAKEREQTIGEVSAEERKQIYSTTLKQTQEIRNKEAREANSSIVRENKVQADLKNQIAELAKKAVSVDTLDEHIKQQKNLESKLKESTVKIAEATKAIANMRDTEQAKKEAYERTVDRTARLKDRRQQKYAAYKYPGEENDLARRDFLAGIKKQRKMKQSADTLSAAIKDFGMKLENKESGKDSGDADKKS